ncbi:hypothetical protein BC828DRAFT_384849 [Blastocladiella britannica]|nr:hypothetical protein BC828DRAFT_384849 [Blastocladiella britannica]
MQSRTTTTLVPFEEDDDDFLYHTNINEMRSPMTLADLCAAFLKKAPSQSSGARLQQQHLVLSIETSYLEHRSVLHQGPLRQGDSLQQGSFQSDSLQHSSYQQDSFHQASFQRGSHSAAKTGCAALPSHPRTVLEAYEDDFDVVVA